MLIGITNWTDSTANAISHRIQTGVIFRQCFAGACLSIINFVKQLASTHCKKNLILYTCGATPVT